MDMCTESITVAGKTIELTIQDIATEKLILDRDNPRIRYRLALETNGKSLDTVINEMPEVAKLRKDIATNGGLRERIIVQAVAGDRFKVVEGNVRFTCISSLGQANPVDSRWKTVPARVLPADVSEVTIAILLSDQHVAGKLAWKAHEKAGQIHHMKNLGLTQDEIAVYLRTNKQSVNDFLSAYSLMNDVFLEMPEYRDKGEGKFSFFLAAYKNKKIKERLLNTPGFKRQLCQWIGQGKIPDVTYISRNRLADVLERPSVRRSFEEASAPSVREANETIGEYGKRQRTWFASIYAPISIDEPEKGEGPNAAFHKALRTFNAQMEGASVADMKTMEMDEMLQRRLVETYETLVNLMSKIGLQIPARKRAAA